MQKKLLAAAVLSTLSGAAFAQSANVTIYGTLYAQYEYGSALGADASAAPTAANGASTSPIHTYSTHPADVQGRLRSDGAGANFGLRGTEDLGNGLQAWFQLELGTAGAIGGVNPSSATSLTGWQAPTYRNSAIGLRGNNWGSFLVGIWDTPYTVAYGQAALVPKLLSVNSANASAGFYGTTPFAAGGTFSGTSIAQACQPFVDVATATAAAGVATVSSGPAGATAATCLTATQNFDRRQGGTLQYWTPNWNGFEGRMMFTGGQENYNGSTNLPNWGNNPTPTMLRPWLAGLSLNYGNGGFFGSYAYQIHKDLTAAGVRNLSVSTTGVATALGAATNSGAGAAQTVGFGNSINGSTEQAHRVGLKYKFDSGFGIGGRFEYLKGTYTYGTSPTAASAVAPTTAAGFGTSTYGANVTGYTKKVWGIAGSYETGPHAVEIEFNKIPNATFQCDSGTVALASSCSGSGTGARQWSIGYDYALSKRTDFQAYFVQIANDTNARYTGAVFNALAPLAGGDPRYIGVGMRHTF
ncbi:MAG TPA: porin [Burkholderiales bacterium]|nr:porin [Burkholderiales bacterium]